MKSKLSHSTVFGDSAKTSINEQQDQSIIGLVRRRSFLKSFGITGVALSAGALLGGEVKAEERSGKLEPGDAAILRFLAAAEMIESDLWQQYTELGGGQDTSCRTEAGAALTRRPEQLDGDMPQYIHDNTDDEFSHAAFLNAYLVAQGATPSISTFRTLPSSKATGAQQIGRLTNLMQLTVDTSWWTRYRSRRHEPGPRRYVRFPQAIPSLKDGQFPAIPRSRRRPSPSRTPTTQAIANTAGFHFASIEQGGTSLYPTLAQRVTDPEVLRILLSIGPTETTHFQTWHDKAGNASPTRSRP